MRTGWAGPHRAALAAALAGAACAAHAQPAERARPALSAQVVQQKAAVLEQAIGSSALAERVKASPHEAARQHFANARELLAHARLPAAAGEHAQADQLLNQAIRELARARQLAPGAEAAGSVEAAYSRRLSESAAPLAGRTLVYGLDFAGPHEEFAFELERHRSFERLMPLAVARFRPAPEVRAIVDRYTAEARRLRESAEAAAPREPARAIQQVTEGTEQLRRALRAAGLDVPQTMSPER